jgi:hypothetical protein
MRMRADGANKATRHRLERSSSLAACIALLLAIAPAAHAQQCSDCSTASSSDSAARRVRVLPGFGIRVGEPQKVSAALGIVAGAEWQERGHDRAHYLGLFAEPGLAASRVSAAYLSNMGGLGSGYGIALTGLRTGSDPWVLRENSSYVGGELFVWPLFLTGPRIGFFRSVHGTGARSWFFTADFGFGL